MAKGTSDVDEEKTGFRSPILHGQESHTLIHLPLTIILEHGSACSRFNVEVQLKALVSELKMDFQEMLNVAPENQRWSFRNKNLNDTDTVAMIGVKRHDIILCRDSNRA